MKNFKRMTLILTAMILAVMSLAGCGKQNDPSADLSNYLNAIYVADAYSKDFSSTFTEQEYKDAKKEMSDTIEKQLVGPTIDELKTQFTDLKVEEPDKKAEEVAMKLKDGVVPPMFKSFKSVKFTTEIVSNDKKNAVIKVKSVPIDMNATMEATMKLFDEKMPKDFDPSTITADNAVESYEKLLVKPMSDACAEAFAKPTVKAEQEVTINMEYNKETKAWEPADADMEKLESIFLV